MHQTIKQIRDVEGQLASFTSRLKKQEEQKELIQSADALKKKLKQIEEKLYQTKNQSPQDPLNFPIRLNNRLSSLVGVVSMGDYRPTKQSYEVRDMLFGEIDQLLAEQKELIDQGIAEFNDSVQKAKIPAIFID